ncbi:PhnD/SsuA/transferrin family substrate-binding protein [Mesorhizobium sp. VNQ89]|uniref:phosphate/phosphite/phosphonate ABC transporter substrate-binding protein n=1 Tax=Mesorhizobium quangtriensis TaxID=3157709 RepID=UPI0032B86A80
MKSGSSVIAALPMYEWPETRAAIDAEWAALRTRLLDAGIDAPDHLLRRNGDMPPVPGGIRDAMGKVVAPDPATLPTDNLDFQTLWKHPHLLLAQTCWGPLEQGLAEHVVVVGQPSYDGIEGGQGALYSSAILMRRGDGEATASPADGRAVLPLDLMRGVRFAYNGTDSMSGVIALTRDLEAVGENTAIFSERIETGAHRASIVAVTEGRADVCAVDCRSWQIAQLYEPRAADVEVVGWTARRKGLPFITSRHTPPDIVERLRAALSGA